MLEPPANGDTAPTKAKFRFAELTTFKVLELPNTKLHSAGGSLT